MATTNGRTRRAAARPAPEPEDDLEDDDLMAEEGSGDDDAEGADVLADDDTEDDGLFDDDADDDFDDARSAFVKMDDLEGRLVLVYPHEVGQRESTLPGQSGKMYDYVVTTTHVLSGKPSDVLETIPVTLDDFQWTGQNIVGQLKPKIRTRRAVLGVLGKKPAQKRGMQDAWILNEPTEKHKVVARKFIAAQKRRKGDVFD